MHLPTPQTFWISLLSLDLHPITLDLVCTLASHLFFFWIPGFALHLLFPTLTISFPTKPVANSLPQSLEKNPPLLRLYLTISRISHPPPLKPRPAQPPSASSSAPSSPTTSFFFPSTSPSSPSSLPHLTTPPLCPLSPTSYGTSQFLCSRLNSFSTISTACYTPTPSSTGTSTSTTTSTLTPPSASPLNSPTPLNSLSQTSSSSGCPLPPLRGSPKEASTSPNGFSSTPPSSPKVSSYILASTSGFR
ncbi:hypothetical protein BDZ91DRAFT_373931 [Kalaharituber pfeilii]|nr:hypothetical protein BDZ91DRAFT_373931 [Kalaharituber pfeilii]